MKFFNQLLRPFLSQEPAFRLIRKTALHQWRLISVNLASNLLGAISEGATLGVVFLAVEVLSATTGKPFNWAKIPLLDSFPALTSWLNGLPVTALFLSLLALSVLLQTVQSITRYLNQLSVGYFAARCRALVTARIHSQVLSLSFPCASNYKVGTLIDYANEGPMAIRIQIEQLSTQLVGYLLCATYLAVLMRISPMLLWVMLVMAIIIILIQKKLLPRIRRGSQAVSISQVTITSRITEDFQGLRLLHSTGQVDAADQFVRSEMGGLESLLRIQARRMSVVSPVSSLLPILTIAIVAGFSVVILGANNNGVLPSLVTFVLGLQKISTRINILTGSLNQMADNSGRLEKLNTILSPEGKEFRRLGGTPFIALQESIRFEEVSLRYSPDLPPALNEISFTLPKGQMLALVGTSGAGKSSIADLLTGLYPPTAGRILIDGIPFELLELVSWQQRLGVVSQDTFLFNATIAENIAFGTSGATMAQIEAACIAAQAAEFIQALSSGYDTLIGERGYRLSGGQRQRLSLARAILRNPELLILDEATSALDSQSERLVQNAIDRFERNHTVLVIAHRLSTIVRADQILVLEAGRVIERGTHSELLGRGGTYHNMWIKQQNNETIATK